MSAPRLVPASAPRTQTWLDNESTTNILAAGPDENDWQWQLSIVEITRDSVFPLSPDTGCQFVALDAPIQLQQGDQQEISLLRMSVRHANGADALRVRLPEGPTRLFNLLLRGEVEGELIARPLNGSMWLPVRERQRWFVHLLSGRAYAQAADEQFELDPGVSVWIDACFGERVRVEGGGELLLVQLLK
jgi:uncharacterized protein